MITKNGSPAAVLISPDEFESWKETISIRSYSSLMGEIQKGLKELKEKKSRLYSLDEFKQRFSYGSIPGYWVHLVDRGNDVEGWLE